MLLQPFQNIGFVWSRSGGKGSRFVIVVDDWFDTVEIDPPSAHAFGLSTIFEEIRQWPDTRAIGFFDLPASNQPADIQKVITIIEQWIAEVCPDDRQDCQYYILVDYYYGEGFFKDKVFGYDFVHYWKETLPFEAKLAHISIGGAAIDDNPYNLDIFKKTTIHERRELPPNLKQWLGYSQHPLDHLWADPNIHKWFTSEHPVMKHDSSAICKYFFGRDRDDDKAQEYKTKVETVLKVKFPVGWWQNVDAVKHIHESLKCLCGAYFCGQTLSSGKRHICVGAAYLIALMAHQQHYKCIDAFVTDAADWASATKLISPIFALQDCETAKSSAKALYDLFDRVLARRDPDGVSAAKKVYFDESGKVLRIQLQWSASNLPELTEFRPKLAQTVKNIFNQENILIPRSAGNTRDAILRLWSHLAISETGFMSPGVVYMEDDTIVIASGK